MMLSIDLAIHAWSRTRDTPAIWCELQASRRCWAVVFGILTIRMSACGRIHQSNRSPEWLADESKPLTGDRIICLFSGGCPLEYVVTASDESCDDLEIYTASC